MQLAMKANEEKWAPIIDEQSVQSLRCVQAKLCYIWQQFTRRQTKCRKTRKCKCQTAASFVCFALLLDDEHHKEMKLADNKNKSMLESTPSPVFHFVVCSLLDLSFKIKLFCYIIRQRLTIRFCRTTTTTTTTVEAQQSFLLCKFTDPNLELLYWIEIYATHTNHKGIKRISFCAACHTLRPSGHRGIVSEFAGQRLEVSIVQVSFWSSSSSSS